MEIIKDVDAAIDGCKIELPGALDALCNHLMGVAIQKEGYPNTAENMRTGATTKWSMDAENVRPLIERAFALGMLANSNGTLECVTEYVDCIAQEMKDRSNAG